MSFNPRPARRPSAAFDAAGTAHVIDWFQSSPGPKAERCADPTLLPDTLNTFQSSPGPKAERCLVRPVAVDDDAAHGVSILARPEGRALRLGSAGTAWLRIRFNPRPARRPSAAQSPGGDTPIQIEFQSSPGPKAERCLARVLRRHDGRRCFNPRPARRPSAACCPFPPDSVGNEVSILARPEGRALPERGVAHLVGDRLVSILARPEGRALPLLVMVPPRCWSCFNPRPARRPSAASRP